MSLFFFQSRCTHFTFQLQFSRITDNRFLMWSPASSQTESCRFVRRSCRLAVASKQLSMDFVGGPSLIILFFSGLLFYFRQDTVFLAYLFFSLSFSLPWFSRIQIQLLYFLPYSSFETGFSVSTVFYVALFYLLVFNFILSIILLAFDLSALSVASLYVFISHFLSHFHFFDRWDFKTREQPSLVFMFFPFHL